MAKAAVAYSPQMKPDPNTRQDVLTPLMFPSREENRANGEIFLLDPAPTPMKVPKFK